MNPLVSILIPAYNSERWIKATLDSALAQTWKNIEIIVVDDGSKDNTFSVAKSFESRNVKVVSQKNSGASSARNKALSFAQGDFIQWLDADDILAADKIEKQLFACGFNPETDKLFSSAWGFFYFSLRRAKFISNNLWQNLAPVDWLRIHLGDGYFMYPAVWLVSRKLTDKAGLWDERLSYNDDGEYFSKVVSKSEMIYFIQEAKSYHRIGNTTSLSNTAMSEKGYISLDLSVTLCIEYLLKLDNSDNSRQACIKRLQKMINNMYTNNSELIDKNKKIIMELGGGGMQDSGSFKFHIMKELLGLKNAVGLKTKLWNMEILLRKNWDKLLYIVSGEDHKNLREQIN
jgi:glycosyltransferase involved in cell wall biosynthesis